MQRRIGDIQEQEEKGDTLHHLHKMRVTWRFSIRESMRGEEYHKQIMQD